MIKDWFAARAGRSQAAREIDLIARWGRSAETVYAQPLARLQEAGGRNPFARAYYGRWRDEGVRDALSGRSRSRQLENRDYDWGWIEGIQHRRSQGFTHPALDAEFERISDLLKAI